MTYKRAVLRQAMPIEMDEMTNTSVSVDDTDHFSEELLLRALSRLESHNRKVVDEQFNIIMSSLRQFGPRTANVLIVHGFLTTFRSVKLPPIMRLLSHILRQASPDLVQQHLPVDSARYLYNGCVSSAGFYMWTYAVECMSLLITRIPSMYQSFTDAGMDLMHLVERVDSKTVYLEYLEPCSQIEYPKGSVYEIIERNAAGLIRRSWEKPTCQKLKMAINEIEWNEDLGQFLEETVKMHWNMHKNEMIGIARGHCFTLLSFILRTDPNIITEGNIEKLLTIVMSGCHRNQDLILTNALLCLDFIASKNPQHFLDFVSKYAGRSEFLEITQLRTPCIQIPMLAFIDIFFSSGIQFYSHQQLLHSLLPCLAVPVCWEESEPVFRALDIITKFASFDDACFKLYDVGILSMLCQLIDRSNASVRETACLSLCKVLETAPDSFLLNFVQENPVLSLLVHMLEIETTIESICPIFLRIIQAESSRGSHAFKDALIALAPWEAISDSDQSCSLQNLLCQS